MLDDIHNLDDVVGLLEPEVLQVAEQLLVGHGIAADLLRVDVDHRQRGDVDAAGVLQARPRAAAGLEHRDRTASDMRPYGPGVGRRRDPPRPARRRRGSGRQRAAHRRDARRLHRPAEHEPQIVSDLAKKMVFLGGPRQVGKTTVAKTILGKDKGYLT